MIRLSRQPEATNKSRNCFSVPKAMREVFVAMPHCRIALETPNYPRRVLRLPDLDHCKLAVLNSLGSPASRHVYEYAINQFIAWYCSEPRLALNRIVVVRYRMHLESRGLAANTINQQLAAVRCLAHEAADSGLLSLWDLEHYLTERRKELDRKYDFRGSRLTDVLGRLLYENRLGEEDLRGLREDKLNSIRSVAQFLANYAA